MTTCPTCHHPAHEWTCTAPVDAGNVYEGFCQCRNSRHEIAGPADTSAVLARVPCARCGKGASGHPRWANTRPSPYHCRRTQSDIIAAHIAATEERLAALEARVEGDEALLRTADPVIAAAHEWIMYGLQSKYHDAFVATRPRSAHAGALYVLLSDIRARLLGRKDKEEA